MSLNNSVSEKDAELLKRLQEGDKTALQEIFDLYSCRVRGLACRLLTGDDEWQDVTLKSFNKLWQKRMKIKAFTQIIGFLLTTTKNACFEYLRKKKRDKRNLKEYAYHLTNDLQYNGETNADQEFISLFELSMAENLQGKKKSTVILTLQGKKDSEIAAILDISVQTVQNYRYLAFEILRRQFLETKF